MNCNGCGALVRSEICDFCLKPTGVKIYKKLRLRPDQVCVTPTRVFTEQGSTVVFVEKDDSEQ